MAGIEIADLRKEYDGGTIVAVDDLSLEIEDGEFVTVVGPSGCGKTTTLRMLAGLEQPTDGTIAIGDKDVTDVHAKNRDVAMVFQNYALYPHKTVFENIEFGLRMSTDLSAAQRRERVEEAAEMMGIGELLEDTPDELSGGQKQRVALGRAIVREPDVFLFDEPLSNLDAKLRKTMRTEIQRLQNELGITSVYVTHDQEEAMTMGDRIVILDGGELQQVGDPSTVYANPVNRFVAGFIGSPSMNFIPGSIDDDGFSSADVSLPFDPEAVGIRTGKEVTLGIRPEDVEICEGSGHAAAQGTVEVVEPIGSDNYVYLDIAEDFIARVDASIEPDVGETVAVQFDEDDIHFFERDTGREILRDVGDRPAATV